MTLTGPDCSRHQGLVDWAAVARAGHDFAIIKATDGIRYGYTSWFLTHFPRVKAAGLVPGAYHFLLAQHPGADQARFYVDIVRKSGGFDGVLAVVDVETGADGGRPSIGTVRDFAAEFRRLVPDHPLIVYTGAWYWVDILGNPRGSDVGPLWHSEYETTAAEVADGPERGSYGGWPAPTIWQHTSTGSCPGVSGNCDLNRFGGDRAQLLALTTGDDDMPLTPAQEKALDLVDDINTRTGEIYKLLLDEGNIGRRSKETTIAVRALLSRTDVDVSETELAAALLPGIVEALDTAAFAAAIPKAVRAELAAALAEPAG